MFLQKVNFFQVPNKYFELSLKKITSKRKAKPQNKLPIRTLCISAIIFHYFLFDIDESTFSSKNVFEENLEFLKVFSKKNITFDSDTPIR